MTNKFSMTHNTLQDYIETQEKAALNCFIESLEADKTDQERRILQALFVAGMKVMAKKRKDSGLPPNPAYHVINL